MENTDKNIINIIDEDSDIKINGIPKGHDFTEDTYFDIQMKQFKFVGFWTIFPSIITFLYILITEWNTNGHKMLVSSLFGIILSNIYISKIIDRLYSFLTMSIKLTKIGNWNISEISDRETFQKFVNFTQNLSYQIEKIDNSFVYKFFIKRASLYSNKDSRIEIFLQQQKEKLLTLMEELKGKILQNIDNEQKILQAQIKTLELNQSQAYDFELEKMRINTLISQYEEQREKVLKMKII